MNDRELVERLRKCDRCENAGWLWRHELDDPEWDGSADDTRYSCPDCQLRREAADAIARLSRGCETCRHRRTHWREECCGLTEVQIANDNGPDWFTYTDCETLGHRCGAWAPREEGRDGE